MDGDWLIAIGAILSGIGSATCGYVALKLARREKEPARNDGGAGVSSSLGGPGGGSDLRVVSTGTDDHDDDHVDQR